MKMYDTPQSVDKYLNLPLECNCGRTHYVPIKAVEIGPGALETLPRYVKEMGYKRPFVICDEITYKIAAARCEELLKAAGIDVLVHKLTHLGFDEATLGEIVVSIPSDADLMIAVGTGSITDMIRYSSYKLRLPCFTVATGAPMDGFAASIGIMNVNNLKATMTAHNTELIIGDTDILRTAPYRMTVAGFGDLIGKLSCLSDWELSRIVNGEHICPQIVELVRSCVNDVLTQSSRIKERDPEVLGKVMEGLVLSGSAISLYGDSRPASGAEHHMSHYWETIMDQRGENHAMHGEQVAVGTVISLILGEELLKLTPDFAAAREKARAYDKSLWQQEVKRCYGSAAGEVCEMEAKAGKNEPENVLRRIDSMEAHWDEIRRLLSQRPSADSLKALLDDMGCPSTPAQIGIDEADLRDTIRFCKETRPRYTLLQAVYDLALTDELTDRLIERLK